MAAATPAGGGRRVTIYDIGKAAAVSASTVSMVLNGNWASYRISKSTAERVLGHASALGYKVNLKARALRLSRSGLAGMIIPHYRNRFFAGLVEHFETEARRRGLCPIVVSTQRDDHIARSVTETLLAQQVEFLFTAGVAEPDALNALCRQAGIASVNIDLPGQGASSVVSDNEGGAHALTRALIERVGARGAPLDSICFLGGIAGEYATEGRLAGFRRALRTHGVEPSPGSIDCCGYLPAAAHRSIAERFARDGRLPHGLFINSITAFEGFTSCACGLPPAIQASFSVGCFDWDPFAAHLPFDVTMMRQDVGTMIAQAFALIDKPGPEPPRRIVVPPRCEYGPRRAMAAHSFETGV